VDAIQAHMVNQFAKFVSMIPYLPDELQVVVMNIKDPGKVTDLIASNLNISLEEKQDLLSTLDVRARLGKLSTILNREIELLELGHKIQSQVQSELNKNQKEFYLRQQLKAIQKELGEGDGKTAEVEELRRRIEEAKMPPEALKAAEHELERLGMIPPESAEHTVVRTYLEWLVSLPWSVSTEDNLDLRHARQVLDEVHKLGMDFRGDPAAALLEVLDPEQNNSFQDHYLDVPFDLQRVMFVTTANVLDPIPPALRDRMEVIELAGYTEEEKLEIARRHLIPKQLAENGLKPENLGFEDDALVHIIRAHTREAGLRNLEREIGRVCRKVARGITE